MTDILPTLPGDSGRGISRAEIELLAPAGSYESLAAAANAGADSIYFGLGFLDMRSGAGSAFGPEDLGNIRERSAGAGMKAYLTLNAVAFDDELDELKRILDAAASRRVDAVIASDPAVMILAAERGIPVHLSTQANVANAESLAFYARFADVVVLARELDLNRVAKIRDSIRDRDIRGPSGEPMRLEMFVHGALCMSISGKCHLSLHQYGRSANRGECLQSCRRSYLLVDAVNGQEIAVDNEYLMSPKDLKTIGFLDRILASGARILKIEGRARSPEYVDATVTSYREAIDSILDGSYGSERIALWEERLAGVFNRGFWDGYYLGQPLGKWTDGYGSKAKKKKVQLGICVNYFTRSGVAEVKLEAGTLEPGVEVLFIGPTTGVQCLAVKEIRIGGEEARVARRGETCSFPVPARVRAGDRVYLWIESAR